MLGERVARYPPARYPIQHATAQFHLGVALLDGRRHEEARAALGAAVRLFDPERLPVEHAKAANALGAVLRLTGRPAEAATAFEAATAAFAAAGQPLEEGAAAFNLGLVQHEAGEPQQAVASFARARELLDAKRAPGPAAAAASEHGAALLLAGDLPAATAALQEAVALADRAGDHAQLGAAHNALGLAHLAAEHPGGAVAAFTAAAGAHPRSLRPAEHAMAKANLALAHERSGDAPRARLAARQGLGVPGAPEPVTAQARELLQRLGAPPGDVLLVLDAQPPGRWPAIVREELVRWADAPVEERGAETVAWVEGQVERVEATAQLIDALLGGLLELPPEDFEQLVRALLEALARVDPDTAGRFRSQTARGMAAFHLPQEARLRETFNRLAAELGQAPEWD